MLLEDTLYAFSGLMTVLIRKDVPIPLVYRNTLCPLLELESVMEW